MPLPSPQSHGARTIAYILWTRDFTGVWCSLGDIVNDLKQKLPISAKRWTVGFDHVHSTNDVQVNVTPSSDGDQSKFLVQSLIIKHMVKAWEGAVLAVAMEG